MELTQANLENIGRLLEGDAPLSEKIGFCEAVAESDAGKFQQKSRAVVWHAYRVLEGERDAAKLLRMIERLAWILKQSWKEKDTFIKQRWECSIMMIMSYLKIAYGVDARESLMGMIKPEWLVLNPPAAVNMLRASVLLAASEAGEGNFPVQQSIVNSALWIFRSTAGTMKLYDVQNCAGHEIVLCAKAIHTLIALYPHLRLPFQGEAYNHTVILSIDGTPCFHNALKTVLPETCWNEKRVIPPDELQG